MMRIAPNNRIPFRAVRSGADPLQFLYAWLVNPAGPLDGRGVARHTFFLLLAVVCLGLSATEGWLRGIGLFFVLVAAVVVREIARLLVAAWLGLRLRAVLVLPIGGLFAYANPESQESANEGIGQFAIAFAGPIAN